MSFETLGASHLLQRDPLLARSPASLRSILKTVDPELRILLWHIGTDAPVKSTSLHPDIQYLLYKHSSLFSTPHELPPNRVSDHLIVLQSGMSVVFVRACRCPCSENLHGDDGGENVAGRYHSVECEPILEPHPSVRKRTVAGDSVWTSSSPQRTASTSSSPQPHPYSSKPSISLDRPPVEPPTALGCPPLRIPPAIPLPKVSVHKISHQEYLDLRSKGPCFRCKGPYSPIHDCPNKDFKMLLGEDGEIGLADFKAMELDEDDLISPPLAQHNRLDVSCYSVGGMTGPCTMKLAASLSDRSRMFLIDSGASREPRLHLLRPRGRATASSDTSPSVSCVPRRWTPHSQGGTLCGPFPHKRLVFWHDEFYVFGLGGLYAILGMAWLCTLGEVKHN